MNLTLLRPGHLILAVSITLAVGSAQAATITVDTTDDAPAGTITTACTLRDAIVSANTAGNSGGCVSGSSGTDVIEFDLPSPTITLNEGELVITNSLTIVGPGMDDLTIDANELSRHFSVDFSTHATQTLVISGLTLANGMATGEGGAIIMYGAGDDEAASLYLEQVRLVDNQANGAGGAVYLQTDACGGLTIEGSRFESNRSASGSGGGLYFDSYLDCMAMLSNSVFDGNETVGSGHGGALFFTSSNFGSSDSNHVQVKLDNVTLSGNSAAGAAGGMAVNLPSSGELSVMDSNIVGNTAEAAGGGIVLVASVGNWHDDVDVLIQNTGITGNEAETGGGLIIEVEQSAGEEVAEVTMLNSQVSNNSAGDQLGDSAGGANLRLVNTELHVESCDFNDNEAERVGGLRVQMSNGSMTMNQVSISGNTVEGVVGGLALDLRSSAQAQMSEVTIAGNTATDYAGMSVGAWVDAQLEIDRSVIRNNVASGSVGGMRTFELAGSLSISGSEIAGNTAAEHAGMMLELDGGAVGITNSTISNNIATGDHGGLYADGSGSLEINLTTIAANQAAANAGVTSGGTTTCVVTNSIMADNAADIGQPSDIDGASCSLSFSLVADDAGSSFTDGGDNIFNDDPLLGPLDENFSAGLTRTHSLGPGSPAVDSGDPAFSPPPDYDQRGSGFDRVIGSAVDMGAYEAQPRLGAAEAVAELADVRVGSDWVDQVVFENIGTVDVLVGPVGSIDGPDAAYFSIEADHCDGQTLSPGETCAIDVRFEPDDRLVYEAEVSISYSGIPGSTTAQFSARGVAPVIELSPAFVSFGNVLVGQSSPDLALDVENTGDDDLEVTALTGLSMPFELVAGGTCGGFDFTVLPQSSCTLLFRFSPDQGEFFSQVPSLISDAFDGSSQFSISGTGLDDPLFHDRFEEP